MEFQYSSAVNFVIKRGNFIITMKAISLITLLIVVVTTSVAQFRLIRMHYSGHPEKVADLRRVPLREFKYYTSENEEISREEFKEILKKRYLDRALLIVNKGTLGEYEEILSNLPFVKVYFNGELRYTYSHKLVFDFLTEKERHTICSMNNITL